ncbi:MAG TPA: hypothetical protein VMW09_04855 [Desulfatiglandales bacterium]|nr:hypothetical protein [Desulfatiglandales bacterium]
MAELILDAEVRLGELLEKITPKRDKQSSTQRTSLPSLPPNIDKRQSHYAQQIAKMEIGCAGATGFICELIRLF